MALLEASGLAHGFGARDLFTGVALSVPEGARIGIVGPNGAGKTTLLRILGGLEKPLKGSVHLAGGCRIGYLRQEAVDAFADRDNSLWDEMCTAFDEQRAREAELARLESELDHHPSDALLDTWGELRHAFEAAGGHDYEVRIRETLQGLGFSAADYGRPLAVLSGGQKTRALLARLLLESTDLLFLDEPTNHLDIGAIGWLEQTLARWRGGVVIVSHDRWFLDRVATTIWDLHPDGIDAYRGNYSAYLAQRDERHERTVAVFEREKERLDKEIDYVKRNIARATTSKQAFGRLKRLSRDLAVIDRFGIEALQEDVQWSQRDIGNVTPLGMSEAESTIARLRRPVRRFARLTLRLRTQHRGATTVLSGDGLVAGYGGRPIVTLGRFVVQRGDCVALVGPNGSGKSTLVKTLIGELPPIAGAVELGRNLVVGYFSQAHEHLARDRTVLGTLLDAAALGEAEARDHLARFLFRQDDVKKRVDQLSGGERGRLALALLAMESANVLVLDEPTNHLDIPAQEVLQDVLEAFEGTILLVSHDRYLVDRLATAIWTVDDFLVDQFDGSWAELQRTQAAAPIAPTPAAAPSMGRPSTGGGRRSREAETQARRRVASITQLERDIAGHEATLEQFDRTIQAAAESGAGDDLTRLVAARADAAAGLARAFEAWEALQLAAERV